MSGLELSSVSSRRDASFCSSSSDEQYDEQMDSSSESSSLVQSDSESVLKHEEDDDAREDESTGEPGKRDGDGAETSVSWIISTVCRWCT